MVYTDEQRAEALEAYVQHGTAEAARLLNIPPRTIRHWANQADLAAARTQNLENASEMLAVSHRAMREELRLRLLEKGLDALDRMDQTHYDFKGKDAIRVEYEVAPSGAFKDYATSAAILIDKYRLEMGETTGRHQVSVEAVESSVDAELRKAIEEMRRQPTP